MLTVHQGCLEILLQHSMTNVLFIVKTVNFKRCNKNRLGDDLCIAYIATAIESDVTQSKAYRWLQPSEPTDQI